MKLWYETNLNSAVENFTVGNDYLLDQKLLKYDCLGSIAHAKMLGKLGILNKAEAQKIVRCLKEIIGLDSKGKFKILKEEEDCHTAIENFLTKKLKGIGKKIHTGRSRNEQVLTALRLYYKDELKNCRHLIEELLKEIKSFVRKCGSIHLPGYTHTRKAMPSSVALWGGALIDSMKDNLALLQSTFNLIDQSPLGTGAGYGSPVKVDRNYTAGLLQFGKIQKNPIYAQNSRGKFESTILHVLTQIMFDLNKIASDVIVFSMPELGYFDIPGELCTGSSAMPQKKNPDVLELLRAKYHEIVSLEFWVKTVIGNLISGYNRDLQTTKEPVMRGFNTVRECLSVAKLIFRKLKVNKKNCQRGLTEEIYATERIYQLVKKGVPFRDAYQTIAKKYIK